MANPSILLSAFADEAANRKTALEQFSALAAIGLRSPAGEQDRELENRLRVMSEAFLHRIDEEDVMKTE